MARAPSAALKRRHAALRAAMSSQSLDALIVTSLPNILYLTNFAGSSAVVIVDAAADRLRFVTDSRYVQSLEDARSTPQACPDLELAVTAGSYDATLSSLLAEYPDRRVGFEAAHLSVSRHGWLSAQLASTSGDAATFDMPPGRPATTRSSSPVLVPTEGLVEALRVIKDAYELDVLREAGRRLSVVAREVLTSVLEGRSEDEVAAEIDWRLRKGGFERSAFDTIVASGPNAALPHARPTERRIHEGDLVVLDFGGVYTSYCVDITRTLAVGSPSDRARAVHGAVLDAQRRAIAAVGAGQSRFAVDAAARDALEAAGFGPAFGHGTGHGLGIEVHELPRIVARRPDVDTRDERLSVGMVFTVEPGAYFPGWGGVRIEDDVAVTERGAELLTDVPYDLVGRRA